jgi:hypothetical protein
MALVDGGWYPGQGPGAIYLRVSYAFGLIK